MQISKILNKHIIILITSKLHFNKNTRQKFFYNNRFRGIQSFEYAKMNRQDAIDEEHDEHRDEDQDDRGSDGE